jgi:glycosyltransferase involved in cell wall biosynthesis
MFYKITVILPVYNGEKFLKKAIDSIIEQSIGFGNIELICIDDCSNDNSKNILNDYASLFKNIKIIFSKVNHGFPGYGRNIGIKNASSKYVMFIDQDDTYNKNICEKFYNIIEKEDMDIVGCNYKVYINGQPNFSNISNFPSNEFKVNPSENKKIFIDINMWNKIFRKSFLNKYKISCPIDSLSEDGVFCVNAFLNTNKMIYLNDFFGYNYNIREKKGEESTINNVSEKEINNLLKGLYKIANIIKDNQREDLMSLIFETHIKNILALFIRLDASKGSKINILNEIYAFEVYFNIKISFAEFWANFINKNILKRHFNVVILFSCFIKLFYNFDFLKQIYRKRYLKILKTTE